MIMNGFNNKLVRTLLGTLLAATLFSCENSVFNPQQENAPNFRIAAPRFLDVRGVDTEQLSPVVIVNDTEVAMADMGNNQHAGTVRVPEGADVVIHIEWEELVGNAPLILADYDRTIEAIDQNYSIRIRDEDYDVSRDEDNDGISNLQERIDETDPFDPFDPGDGGIKVSIPYVDPDLAPAINGSWETVWNRATFLDRTGETLSIDNLMINRGAVRSDGATEYKWGAMHDASNLYLWVEGSLGTSRTHFGDSALTYNDDSIEIFWDGNNSKDRFYDLEDDFQVIIPLLTFGDGGSNNSSLSNARIAIGENSLPAPTGIEFATCIFCSNDIWEIKIPLDQAKIPVGSPIGFEVQLDDDNDGDDRDVKWGWVHPSRTTYDVDETWKDPSFMSTVRLVPSPVLSND